MKHVFIIEDDISILEGLRFLLEKTYRVTSINDGSVAFNKLKAERPDLILLDFLMPDLNVAAFIKSVSRLNLNIPMLVMSAYPDVEKQLKDVSVVGFIKKPFQLDELVITIKQVLA